MNRTDEPYIKIVYRSDKQIVFGVVRGLFWVGVAVGAMIGLAYVAG